MLIIMDQCNEVKACHNNCIHATLITYHYISTPSNNYANFTRPVVCMQWHHVTVAFPPSRVIHEWTHLASHV